MKIYKEGLEKYPLTHIIGQNIFLLIYFWIGIIGMLPLKIYGFPIISVIYGLLDDGFFNSWNFYYYEWIKFFNS